MLSISDVGLPHLIHTCIEIVGTPYCIVCCIRLEKLGSVIFTSESGNCKPAYLFEGVVVIRDLKLRAVRLLLRYGVAPWVDCRNHSCAVM